MKFLQTVSAKKIQYLHFRILTLINFLFCMIHFNMAGACYSFPICPWCSPFSFLVYIMTQYNLMSLFGLCWQMILRCSLFKHVKLRFSADIKLSEHLYS